MQYELPSTVRVEWLPDGDHSFKPRKTSGYSEAGNLEKAVQTVAAFVHRV